MNRIRELRIEKGWRQEDLAEKMHIKRQTVARYETGVLGIDADTICHLCDICGVTADYLLCRSDNPDPVISDADAAVLYAYHNATPEIRAIIDAALAPYRRSVTASTGTA